MNVFEKLSNIEPVNTIGLLFGAVGVIGVVLSTIFYFKQKNRQVLEYGIKSTPLITDSIASIPGLKISLNNQDVKELISTTVTFSNRGNITIEESDFAKNSPLAIVLQEKHDFRNNISIVGSDKRAKFWEIQNQTINNTNKNADPKLIILDNEKMVVDIDFLKPYELISITVLHSGGKIDVSGDLKSGKISKTNINKSFKLIDIIAIFVLIVSALVFIFSFLPISHAIKRVVLIICATVLCTSVPAIISMAVKFMQRSEDAE